MSINDLTFLQEINTNCGKFIVLGQVSSTEIQVLNHPDNTKVGEYSPEIKIYDVRDLEATTSVEITADFTSAAFNAR